MSTYKFSFSWNIGSAQSPGNLGEEDVKVGSKDQVTVRLRHEQRIATHIYPKLKSQRLPFTQQIFTDILP